MTKRVLFPSGPEALRKEGLREVPEVWEDGLRVDPKPGYFEWWYFDAHFEDGSTAVITFFTKSPVDHRSALKPGVSISITRPDGKRLSETASVSAEDFSSSKERCYVRVGKSWVRGDLCCYELDARAQALAVQLEFTAIVPAWRPGTGKNYYDELQSRYFAWFPAIPYGAVEGHLIYDGKIHNVTGYCYHDHNWGNVKINEVLSHWYWGRAHVGDFTLIFAEMNAVAAYGNQKVPVFMLAQGADILIGDGAPLKVKEHEPIADPGGRSYSNGIDLTWKSEAGQVEIALRKPHLIDSFSLLQYLPAWQRVIGRLVANPYYFRFNAPLELNVDLSLPSGKVQVQEQGQGLYELMLLRGK
jgi:predicted secreted hydrolase